MNQDNHSKMIEIFAGSPVEARLVENLLNDANIHTFLKDELMGSIAPWQVAAGGAGSVKVVIDSLDYEQAKQIIEKHNKNWEEAQNS